MSRADTVAGSRRSLRRLLALFAVLAMVATLLQTFPAAPGEAATPDSGTLAAPAGSGTVSVSWTGGPYTSATPETFLCVDSAVNCDYFEFTVDAPADYWDAHEGGVTVEIFWESTSDDFDLYVYDSSGSRLDASTSGSTNYEGLEFPELAPGTYTVEVLAWLTTDATYSGTVTLDATEVPPAMRFTEDKDTIMDMLTVDYPLNVIFVGYHPTPEEVAELRDWIPAQYQPTVASKSPPGDEIQNEGAGLLNWNKNHLIDSDPFFLGIRFNYDIRIIQASDEYARALFQVAEDHTAQDYAFQSSADGEDLARYDASFGHFRVVAKGGDPAYKVTDPTRVDLIDAYAVEDWIFDSRHDPAFDCAFTDLETGECYDPSIIQPQSGAYHDPYYDRFGLNLDHMPQGVNQGSSFFFLDTFGPDYAADYFRPNAYHNYGTDMVIDGQVLPGAVEDGGSWRITDPDTGDWDGVDYARTWGGRYRFHFVDLGAAPNNFESASWLRAERKMSSDYPHGDPPIWQYQADPQWQQTGDECAADPQVTDYTGGTPCRMMPRLGRDVGYGLFFRSTAGYLYRPIPRGDVYWLAVSNWTDFYSRPQWIEGQLTNLPWYGTWWTNLDKLYKINQVGDNDDDVLRWLSSALPYARWVGRKGEVIELYDPTNNQPTGQFLDTSPKYEDLPAPAFHVYSSAFGTEVVPEPLYPGDDNHVVVQYGSSTVDLTEVSNAVEKAKAQGIIGLGYDSSVDHTFMRDFIDANRPGIADIVEGVNTIPSINMVFEKTYTWALPAIVGGIAVQTNDGEAWGVMNNVNDRFKWSESHYPGVQPGDAPGSKRSMTDQSLPTQDNGTGFSYTIEHEAAHNLGLSHPHDGSYGVDKCTEGPNAGEWKCYWSGLGWMYDISAAPTTYAMAYRPYEVEDQDNLQRGHVAEYLVAAQKALKDRLLAEAQAGNTQPSAAWNSDFARMAEWRDQAAELFRCGDYLHAEYAARNASLAARGIPQTAQNTSDPRLVEAGQVFYFNVHPQGICGPDGGNQPPTAVAAADPTQATVGQTVTFDGTGSSDDTTPADQLGYEWDFDGDGTVDSTDAVATHAFGTAGAYEATLTVTDHQGLTGSDTVTVTVAAAPQGGGKVTGGGYLTTVEGRKLNFGFNAKQKGDGSLQGNLQLNDKEAGVKIHLKDLTALGGVTGSCGSVSAGPDAVEFRGDGTFDGDPARFRVCVEDGGEGNGAVDRFVLECLAGCDYTTVDRVTDDVLTGGNIQVHEAPATAAGGGAGTPPEPGSGKGAAPEGQGGATVLVLDPVLLTEAPAGSLQSLSVTAYGADGEPLAGVTVSLDYVTVTGLTGTMSAVTGAAGTAPLVVTVPGVEVEYTARVGGLGSNAVHLSGTG